MPAGARIDTRMLDLYCERTGPGLWGEPLNLVSNLAFFVAAFGATLIVVRIRRTSTTRAPTGGLVILAVFIIAIGLGSALFHAIATPRALAFDALPVITFQVVFLWLYLRRVAGAGRGNSALLVAGLLGCALAGHVLSGPIFEGGPTSGGRGLLNGSLPYVPGAALLLALGVSHYSSGRREPLALLAAGGLFSLALLFRTFDQALCPSWSLGTHFLWHLLNAGVLYLAFRAYAANVSLYGQRRA